MANLTPRNPSPANLTPQETEHDHSALVFSNHGNFRMLPGETLTFTCGADGKVTAKQHKAADAGGGTKVVGNARQAALEKVLGGLRAPKMDK